MVDRRPPVRLGVHVYADVKVEAEVQQFPVPRRATCGCTAYPRRNDEWLVMHALGTCRDSGGRVLSWDDFVQAEGEKIAFSMAITPAMAPDGWAKLQDTKTCESEIYEGKLLANNVVVENRHAVAALALHGQLFGFTWADVDALDGARSATRSYEYEYGSDVRGADNGTLPELVALASLRDRIAALLPPRTEGA